MSKSTSTTPKSTSRPKGLVKASDLTAKGLDIPKATRTHTGPKGTSAKVKARIAPVQKALSNRKAVLIVPEGHEVTDRAGGVKVGGKPIHRVNLTGATVSQVRQTAVAYCRENDGAEFTVVDGCAILVK